MSFADDPADPAVGAFVDPLDPTDDELRAWAARDAPWPMPGWDVVLGARPAVEVLMEIADDERHPAGGRWTMLSALYLRAEVALRSGGEALAFAVLADDVARGRRYGTGPVARWAERTGVLLADPAAADRSAWCDGRLAAEDIPA